MHLLPIVFSLALATNKSYHSDSCHRIITFAVAVALTCFTITASINRHIQIPVYTAIWAFVVLLLFGTLCTGGEEGLEGTMNAFLKPVTFLMQFRPKVKWPRKEAVKEIELGTGLGLAANTGLGTSDLMRNDSTKKRKGSWFAGWNVPIIVIERKSEDEEKDDPADEEQPAAPPTGALTASPRPQLDHSHSAADAHSVRSTHSRFTTSTVVSSDRTRGAVQRAVRRMTDGTGRALTLFIPKVATSSRRGAARGEDVQGGTGAGGGSSRRAVGGYELGV